MLLQNATQYQLLIKARPLRIRESWYCYGNWNINRHAKISGDERERHNKSFFFLEQAVVEKTLPEVADRYRRSKYMGFNRMMGSALAVITGAGLLLGWTQISPTHSLLQEQLLLENRRPTDICRE